MPNVEGCSKTKAFNYIDSKEQQAHSIHKSRVHNPPVFDESTTYPLVMSISNG